MGGGVVRNRFRQARYDKLKAALVVQRAKQPAKVVYDPDSEAFSGPELLSSESESDGLPGNVAGDPESSDSDGSSDGAEFALPDDYTPECYKVVSSGAGNSVQQGGTTTTTTTTTDTQGGVTPTGHQVSPGADYTVHQGGTC